MTAQRSFRLTSPRARMTGIVYLLYFLMAILAQFLTAHKLVAYGTGTNLIATSFYCFLTLLFYGLFKPVNRMISFIAGLFSLTGCVLMTLDFTLQTPPAISPLLFFGPYCLLIGYLIYRSTFLPHILGAFMALAGVGWLVYLIPNLPNFVSIAIDAIGICAEASLMLWLIVRGVNMESWKQQAGVAEK
jgi:Domain of unknown function (DUF4386)